GATRPMGGCGCGRYRTGTGKPGYPTGRSRRLSSEAIGTGCGCTELAKRTTGIAGQAAGRMYPDTPYEGVRPAVRSPYRLVEPGADGQRKSSPVPADYYTEK